ncbi:MAG TPA: M20/M25/M40 family metallo-hydrolase [Chitinophagaceae bacterium]|nr:M20/M25/M40 family metallo-hydrolase [Chitinophagaceae bacterium]
MLKKLMYLAALLLIVVAVIVVVNTMGRKPWPVHKAAALLRLPDSAVAHMSESIRIATVSPGDTSYIDSLHFNQFRIFLERAYPLLHRQLTRTIIKDYSYLYEWKGTDSSLLPIILMGHYDVVPVEPAAIKLWTVLPFGGEVIDNIIWGRGAVDDKAAVISILEATEQLLKEGFKPARTILLCFGHNEESTGTGAIAIVEHLQQQHIKADMVIDEGGEITTGKMKDVNRPIAMIGVGEKGYVTFELSVQKPGGHSSKPDKETAIDILAAGLYRLRSVQMPVQLTEPLAEYFHRVSGSSNDFVNKMALSNLWLFKPWVQKRLGNLPDGDAMQRTTIVPTILESGIRENVIPTQARAIVNSRILTGETTAAVQAFIKKAINDDRITITIKGDFNTEPSPLTPINSAAFKRMEEAVYETIDSVIPVPYVMLGASDSRNYRAISNGVINFTPLVNSKGFHGIDERLPIIDFQRSINFFTRIIQQAGKPI